MNRLTHPLALTLLALPPSCLVARGTVNQPIDATAVADLEIGKTSASEVASLLGAPAEVIQLGKRSAWRFDYVQSKQTGFFMLVIAFSNKDTRTDRVWVFFDENDLLTNVGSTFESGGTEYLMPWQDIDYE